MTQSITSIEAEDRAFVIISNNEVKTAEPDALDFLDMIADSHYGITRLSCESDIDLRRRIMKSINKHTWNTTDVY